MTNKQDFSKGFTPRENFLIFLVNKLTNEYKRLLNHIQMKPYKIVEILTLSTIPGETRFAIQITHKNCILTLSAAEIFQNYDLNVFSNFHAEMISKAEEGKLVEFFKLTEIEPAYKIVSKRFDSEFQQYVFTVEDREAISFMRTAQVLSNDKNLLLNIGIHDIYDIGYTLGVESILKEKSLLLLAKQKNDGRERNIPL